LNAKPNWQVKIKVFTYDHIILQLLELHFSEG